MKGPFTVDAQIGKSGKENGMETESKRHRLRVREDGRQVVKKAVMYVVGRPVRYQLFAREMQYFLEICMQNARHVLEIGEDFAVAALVFERFRRGRVTPCSAEYVWEDLCEAHRYG